MKNIKKIETARNYCYAFVLFIMCMMGAAIITYYRSATPTPFVMLMTFVYAATIPTCGIALLVLYAIVHNHSKEYHTPIERLNTAFIAFTVSTVLVLEALIGAYMVFGYENFIIINIVALYAVANIALIPLGAIAQLVIRIDHQLHVKKRIKEEEVIV